MYELTETPLVIVFGASAEFVDVMLCENGETLSRRR